MQITVTCACGAGFPVEASFAGRRMKCSACGALVTVPRPGAAALSPSPVSPLAPAAAPAPVAPAPSPSPAAAGEGRGEGVSAPPSAPVSPLAPAPAPLAARRPVDEGWVVPRRCPGCGEIYPVHVPVCKVCRIDLATGRPVEVDPLDVGARRHRPRAKGDPIPPSFGEILVGAVVKPASTLGPALEELRARDVQLPAAIAAAVVLALVATLAAFGYPLLGVDGGDLAPALAALAVGIALVLVLALQGMAAALAQLIAGARPDFPALAALVAALFAVTAPLRIGVAIASTTLWPWGFGWLGRILQGWLPALLAVALLQGAKLPPGFAVAIVAVGYVLERWGLPLISASFVRMLHGVF
ncbi:MAG: hypothetical protein HZA54_00655 [Planctomycetes bacterium]|nr:hypothetical protein [Planctomycetota bacterium]